MSYIADRVKERVSQAAIAAALTAIAAVAGQPSAWQEGSLPMWLGLVQPLALCLIAILVPDGIGATVASLAGLTPPVPSTPVLPPAPVPPANPGLVTGSLLLILLLAVGGLSACSAPATTGPTQSDLLMAEDGYQAALIGAAAYSGLPACGAGATLCRDPAVVSDIALAETSASVAFVQAETAILGCPLAQWRASQAVPPTAACGLPLAGQDGQTQALTAVKAVVLTLVGVVPAVASDPAAK